MKQVPILSAIMFSALLAAAGTVYAQQPPDVVQSDAAFNTAMGTSVMPLIDTGLRDGFFGAQRNTGVGYSALIADVTGNENTAVGTFALNWNNSGNNNSATGYMALACNTTGSSNTADGNFALSSLYSLGGVDSCTAGFGTADGNTASGAFALAATTSGSYNAGLGYSALSSNTDGNYNIASGAYALQRNTAGYQNTASGYQALNSNTVGNHNTASGSNSLYSNTNGDSNTASGDSALYTNTTGYHNTAFGEGSLLSNTTGSNNTALGSNAGYNLTYGSNDIDLGNEGVAGESGIIRIGTSSTQVATYIAGIENAKVTGSAVYVTASGQLGVLASSERYKTAIAPMGAGTEKLQELRPVSFHLKTDPKGSVQYGLIAEEVANVYPELVIRDGTGKIQGVRYDELAPMLLNEVQKQAVEIRELKQQQQQFATQAELNDLKQQLQAALAALRSKDELVARR
jgi:hypothetical protein